MSAGSGFDAAGVWSVLDGARGVLDPSVERLLVALTSSNADQWDAEDRARSAPTDAAVAAQKVAIDALNAQRVALVFALDTALVTLLHPAPSAPPVTESPGSVCDRLSVLRLRIVRLDKTQGPAARRSSALAQAAELRWAFDVMLTDVREGRRRFTAHEPNKVYGSIDDTSSVAHVH